MNYLKILCVVAIVSLSSCGVSKESAERESPLNWVNPFIGTDGPGNTYPGASAPFGMVQLSPDGGLSGWDRIAGYFYPDSTIASFSMTHLTGTGAGDLYDIAFMPAVAPYKESKELGVYSNFSHKNESATAGYYRVLLDDYNTLVELTASSRCGYQRYTFPKADTASVFVNLARSLNWDATVDSYIKVVDSMTIEGYRYSTGWAPNQKVFFISRFSKPFRNNVIDKKPLKNGSFGYIARFDFSTDKDEQIEVATAISSVSINGAHENLKREIGSRSFNEIKRSTERLWERELSKIEVETPDSNYKTLFYTAMYQSMLAPTIFMDVDGGYRGADGAIHRAKNYTNYSTFSLWDTFRAAHPLYTITQKDRVSDMVKSMIEFYDQHGVLPVWPLWGEETDMMIGFHSIPVIVDAYLKGIDIGNPERAFEACVNTMNKDSYRGIGEYKLLGYVPADKEGESLSKTMEYAYDDYCVARFAEKLGKDSIAKVFYARSGNYRNLYNPTSSFIEPRNSDGKFLGAFDPKSYTEHITESNAWQYFWFVPQDIDGLISLVGGPKRFGEKLDSMFMLSPTAGEKLPIFSTGMIGQYAHGNEPSHHVAYLYNYIGQPEKTQKRVREILATQYGNAPGGHCGNEDCGQMSAWFVFSSMGFYPIDPVGGVYALGSPLFDRVTITLPNKNKFIITAENNSPKNVYVESVTLNGKPLTSMFINHDDIMAGGELHFVMKP